MKELITESFRKLIESIAPEVKKVPLSCWNESVLRYFFCRVLADASPSVKLYVECDRIDLVVVQPPKRAFIEFKFYQRSERIDAYDDRKRGYKGGPSAKNVIEFRTCIDDLCRRGAAADLSKYIILVYLDAKNSNRLTFASSYDDYNNPAIGLVDRRTVEIAGAVLCGNLYEVVQNPAAISSSL